MTRQLPLLDPSPATSGRGDQDPLLRQPEPRGSTFEPALDRERLGHQLGAVADFMRGGGWHTLAEISAATGAPEASASARLRDLRRAGFVVERRRRGDARRGLHEYRLIGGGD